jgi:hypothetical protein
MKPEENIVPSTIANSVASTVSGYTWLLMDVFVFLVVSVSLLVYKDLDESGRSFTRIAIVFLFCQLWVSSLHILVSMRSVGSGKKILPWYMSYFFFLVKLVLIGCAIYWLCQKRLV